MSLEDLKKVSPSYIAKTARECVLKINDKYYKSTVFQTLQINLEHLLQELMKISADLGIKIVNRKINDTEDIINLDEKVIVNCTGLGSKHIFNDQNLYGVKGYLLEFENPTKIKGIYGFLFEGKPVKMYCLEDKILVGLTK